MNYFIDCGTNLGQGLEKITSRENISGENWRIYSFEANPFTYNYFQKHQSAREHTHFFNVGVSDRYGFQNFNCEIWEEQDDYIGGGSSLVDLADWNTEKVYGWKPGERFEKYRQVMVPVVDLGDFIDILEPEERSIVLKLDIEGSEYKVLSRLCELQQFPLLKKVYVEFHDHILEKAKGQRDLWVDQLSGAGVEVILWD